MKTLTEYNDNLYLAPITENILTEGVFDWLTNLFKRISSFTTNYKKRFGKEPSIDLRDTKTLQVSKPAKGQFDSSTAKDIASNNFKRFNILYKQRKKYFVDKDGNELKPETVTYVYTPDNALSKDEKYMVAIGVHSQKGYFDDYVHIIDFEVSDSITDSANITADIFSLYIDKVIKHKNAKAKGVTTRYIHNANEYGRCKYNNKSFEIADNTQQLLKLDFN